MMTTTTAPDIGLRAAYGPACAYCGAPMNVALMVAGVTTHPGCPETRRDHEPNHERTSR